MIAVLMACVMMFSIVEPACARTWGEFFAESAVGGVIGGVIGAASFFIVGEGAVVVALAGAVLGALIGAATEDARNQIIVNLVIAGVTTIITSIFAGPGIGTTAGIGAGGLNWLRKH